MRISDWSSDVCSSDLIVAARMAPISLTEIAAATGFGKSASQRLTHTLTALGYLEKNPETRRYRMTVRALDLAHGFLITDPLINEGLLHLIDASEDRKSTRLNSSH